MHQESLNIKLFEQEENSMDMMDHQSDIKEHLTLQ
jgi:hypothetical protein